MLALTCVVVDKVGLPLVSVGLLPVRGEGPQAVIVWRVRVSGVSVVLGDVALATAPAGVVWTHTCNVSRHITNSGHFLNIVIVVVVVVVVIVAVVVVLTGVRLLPTLLLPPERLEAARHGHHQVG